MKAEPRCSRQNEAISRKTTKALIAILVAAGFAAVGAAAPPQGGEAKPPVVVQPGAPGQPSRILPSDTTAVLPPASKADVDFMQGMIFHHSQAIVMTAWIPTHTNNKDLQLLGERISSSQSDEMKFMERWLALRGESYPKMMPGMSDMDMNGQAMAPMPGMLTAAQMDALSKAKGAEFDRLFLVGMIQHHQGAVTMVKDLFDTPGAGQDAALFDFATDADNTQRAEIRIMHSMLDKEFPKEKE